MFLSVVSRLFDQKLNFPVPDYLKYSSINVT